MSDLSTIFGSNLLCWCRNWFGEDPLPTISSTISTSRIDPTLLSWPDKTSNAINLTSSDANPWCVSLSKALPYAAFENGVIPALSFTIPDGLQPEIFTTPGVTIGMIVDISTLVDADVVEGRNDGCLFNLQLLGGTNKSLTFGFDPLGSGNLGVQIGIDANNLSAIKPSCGTCLLMFSNSGTGSIDLYYNGQHSSVALADSGSLATMVLSSGTIGATASGSPLNLKLREFFIANTAITSAQAAAILAYVSAPSNHPLVDYGATPEAARLIVLGDSISADNGTSGQNGYVDKLVNRLNVTTPNACRLFNYSIGGITSTQVLAATPAWLASGMAGIPSGARAVALIEVGTNDLFLASGKVNTVLNNLTAMVSLAKAAGATPIVVNMPPRISNSPHNTGYAADAAAVNALLAECGAPVVDVTKIWNIQQVNYDNCAAGNTNPWVNIHPNDLGSQAWADVVYPVLAPLLAMPNTPSAQIAVSFPVRKISALSPALTPDGVWSNIPGGG
jgi:lysophospholipase L1-like esterase